MLASSDGATASSTRVCGVLCVIAFIVKMFWKPDASVLTADGVLILGLFAVRDGGPIDAFVQAKVAVAAAGVAGAPPPSLSGVSP